MERDKRDLCKFRTNLLYMVSHISQGYRVGHCHPASQTDSSTTLGTSIYHSILDTYLSVAIQTNNKPEFEMSPGEGLCACQGNKETGLINSVLQIKSQAKQLRNVERCKARHGGINL